MKARIHAHACLRMAVVGVLSLCLLWTPIVSVSAHEIGAGLGLGANAVRTVFESDASLGQAFARQIDRLIPSSGQISNAHDAAVDVVVFGILFLDWRESRPVNDSSPTDPAYNHQTTQLIRLFLAHPELLASQNGDEEGRRLKEKLDEILTAGYDLDEDDHRVRFQVPLEKLDALRRLGEKVRKQAANNPEAELSLRLQSIRSKLAFAGAGDSVLEFRNRLNRFLDNSRIDLIINNQQVPTPVLGSAIEMAIVHGNFQNPAPLRARVAAETKAPYPIVAAATVVGSAAGPSLRIGITGAGGFVGSRLANALERAGYPLVVSDVSADRLSKSGTSVRQVVGQLLDRAVLERVLANSSSIIHLAAIRDPQYAQRNPTETIATNALGTLLLARLAGDRRVVFASSELVYPAGGRREGIMREEEPLPLFEQYEITAWLVRIQAEFNEFARKHLAGQASETPLEFTRAFLDRHPIPQAISGQVYGVSKYLGELFMMAQAQSSVSLRFSTIYGPGEAFGKMPMLIERMLLNKPLNGGFALWPDRRQYLYVDDLIIFLIQFASIKNPPRLVNVAAPGSIDTPNLSAMIQQLTGSSSPIEIDTSPAVLARVRLTYLVTSLLERSLAIAFTPLEEGLSSAIAYQRAKLEKGTGHG